VVRLPQRVPAQGEEDGDDDGQDHVTFSAPMIKSRDAGDGQ
jgi:hypothetical protein